MNLKFLDSSFFELIPKIMLIIITLINVNNKDNSEANNNENDNINANNNDNNINIINDGNNSNKKINILITERNKIYIFDWIKKNHWEMKIIIITIIIKTIT